ncbi:MAG: dTDP-4-dehydrorhamnose reductase [Candidatus Omnitrophica bacterium]|nr:dTDP-4-dehydrorhamnose reductase [Candidatus Omnitrophota bacterium]
MSGREKMLVTGSGGMVGSYVSQVFQDFDLILTDIRKGEHILDVRRADKVDSAIRSAGPDFVLHLAAATDVDRCEQEPDWAYETNAMGTQNVALACQKHHIPMIYISTAGVFWGDQEEPYIEYDEPRPCNVYGVSKLAGERIVTSLLPQFYIVRAGWMIGGGGRDKKFVGKICRLIADGHSPIKVVSDKWGTPTYARDLLQGVRTLIRTGYYGLYHMSNRGKVSRYDIALAIRDILKRTDVEIIPVSSGEFPLPAARARSESIRNFKLEKLGIYTMRTWREALEDYLRTEIMKEVSCAPSS